MIGLATEAGCQLVAKDIFLIGLATVAGCQLVTKDIFLLLDYSQLLVVSS